MKNDRETELTEQWLKDLPVSIENQSFSPEEMLTCKKCNRKSPPTRVDCFYCGAELPVSELQKQFLKLNLRKLELWEKGYNVILLKKLEAVNSADISEIANFLGFENEDIDKIFKSEKPLPIARVEYKTEAEAICEKLQLKNIESRIIGDETLKPEIAPRRLRGIEFFDGKLKLLLFNNEEAVEASFENFSLIVVGAAYERKIESVESIRRKEKGKVLDSTETGTDELLIDVYTQNDEIGYRIESKGFDFSCLAEEKGLIAGENIKRLANKLKRLLANIKYDDNYLNVRAELGKVWEVEEKINAGGVNRKYFGTYRKTNIVIVSNRTQFTRYSRLQKQIL